MRDRTLLCADHGTPLRYRIDTDGRGNTVDLVESCRECTRPRFVVKQRKIPKPNELPNRWDLSKAEREARDQDIRRRRLIGERVAEIAVRYNISSERVRQICAAGNGPNP